MNLKVINKNEELQEFVKTVNSISYEVTDKLRETNIFIDEYLNSHQEIIPEMGNYFFSIESLRHLIEKNNFTILNMQTFHLVHLNTFFQKLISPFMFLMKLKPEKYRPYLRLIAKK